MSDELAMLDGVIAPSAETVLPVTDQGFIRGDGAFEVVRVYGGSAFLMDEHLDRIERSAANLRLDGPVERELIHGEVTELLERRAGDQPFDGALRLILTRGGRRLLMTEPLPELPERLRLATVTYAPTRVLDGVKSLSYAANMLCSRLARERGFDDAVLVTPHGRVLELPTASLFWVGDDGVLCTTPLSEHVLASITRAHLMRLLEVEERVITAEQLLEVREAFVASTAREVHPVAAIEDRQFEQVGEVTRKAAGAFSAHIDELLGR
ncbi:MAG TPA: aminotransferase class IV [Thermoleophilaceae bacterium]|nr:aminotransferase class IV [Thermoleophilaceae bacterium]